MQPYLIVIIVFAAILVLIFLFAALCEFSAFGRRYDKNKVLKYFSAQDFGLEVQEVSLARGLKGFIYSKPTLQKSEKLIIFCHGMGAGHIAYTTEIAYFCNLGYKVLAVDSKGCNFSGGRAIGGMYQGVKTAVAAIDYANTNARLKDKQIYLVGHSWGAYSALCASAERKVGGVVAISAPETPSKTLQQASAPMLSKPVAAILRPFWWLNNFLRYGVKGNLSASKCLKKSGVSALLIHGDNDNIVTLANSAFGKSDGKNVTKFLARGKAHNPYNTQNAEKLLCELSLKLKNGAKDLSDFDFYAATEEDAYVMEKITEFIEKN